MGTAILGKRGYREQNYCSVRGIYATLLGEVITPQVVRRKTGLCCALEPRKKCVYSTIPKQELGVYRFFCRNTCMRFADRKSVV